MLEIWTTMSSYQADSQIGLLTWHYLFAANLSHPFTVTTADMGVSGQQYLQYDYHAIPFKVSPFNDTSPVLIPQGKIPLLVVWE